MEDKRSEFLKFVTRSGLNVLGNTSESTPKIYLSYYSKDAEFRDKIITTILNKIDAIVYYLDYDILVSPDINEISYFLSEMQLAIIPVSKEYLDISEDNFSVKEEYPYFLKIHLPILPIMEDESNLDKYTSIFKNLQYYAIKSDSSAISFDQKLEIYLKSFVLKDNEYQKAKGAFKSHLFLSYRKIDREHANEFLQSFYEENRCRDIAIWYDEFLTGGKDFEKTIKNELNRSKVFLMMVTPNVLGKNYIKETEYPLARKLVEENKISIVPIEGEKTDLELLEKEYNDIPKPKKINEINKEVINILHSSDNTFSKEKKYNLGLAFLYGVNVRRNTGVAFDLIKESSDEGYIKAKKLLASMYQNGNGVAYNYDKALELRKEILKELEKKMRYDIFDESDEEYYSFVSDLLDNYISAKELNNEYKTLINDTLDKLSKYDLDKKSEAYKTLLFTKFNLLKHLVDYAFKEKEEKVRASIIKQLIKTGQDLYKLDKDNPKFIISALLAEASRYQYGDINLGYTSTSDDILFGISDLLLSSYKKDKEYTLNSLLEIADRLSGLISIETGEAMLDPSVYIYMVEDLDNDPYAKEKHVDVYLYLTYYLTYVSSSQRSSNPNLLKQLFNSGYYDKYATLYKQIAQSTIVESLLSLHFTDAVKYIDKVNNYFENLMEFDDNLSHKEQYLSIVSNTLLIFLKYVDKISTVFQKSIKEMIRIVHEESLLSYEYSDSYLIDIYIALNNIIIPVLNGSFDTTPKDLADLILDSFKSFKKGTFPISSTNAFVDGYLAYQNEYKNINKEYEPYDDFKYLVNSIKNLPIIEDKDYYDFTILNATILSDYLCYVDEKEFIEELKESYYSQLESKKDDIVNLALVHSQIVYATSDIIKIDIGFGLNVYLNFIRFVRNVDITILASMFAFFSKTSLGIIHFLYRNKKEKELTKVVEAIVSLIECALKHNPGLYNINNTPISIYIISLAFLTKLTYERKGNYFSLINASKDILKQYYTNNDKDFYTRFKSIINQPMGEINDTKEFNEEEIFDWYVNIYLYYDLFVLTPTEFIDLVGSSECQALKNHDERALPIINKAAIKVFETSNYKYGNDALTISKSLKFDLYQRLILDYFILKDEENYHKYLEEFKNINKDIKGINWFGVDSIYAYYNYLKAIFIDKDKLPTLEFKKFVVTSYFNSIDYLDSNKLFLSIVYVDYLELVLKCLDTSEEKKIVLDAVLKSAKAKYETCKNPSILESTLSAYLNVFIIYEKLLVDELHDYEQAYSLGVDFEKQYLEYEFHTLDGYISVIGVITMALLHFDHSKIDMWISKLIDYYEVDKDNCTQIGHLGEVISYALKEIGDSRYEIYQNISKLFKYEDMITSYEYIYHYYMDKNDVNNALFYLLKAETLLKKKYKIYNEKELFRTLYRRIADIYQVLGDDQKSYEYFLMSKIK